MVLFFEFCRILNSVFIDKMYSVARIYNCFPFFISVLLVSFNMNDRAN